MEGTFFLESSDRTAPFVNCLSLAHRSVKNMWIAASARMIFDACDFFRGLFHIRFRRFYCWWTKTAKEKMPQLLHKTLLACDDQQIGKLIVSFQKHSPWRWKHHLHVAELRWWKEKLPIKMEKWVSLKVIHLISKGRVSILLRWVIWEFLGMPLRHTVPTKNMYRHITHVVQSSNMCLKTV